MREFLKSMFLLAAFGFFILTGLVLTGVYFYNKLMNHNITHNESIIIERGWGVRKIANKFFEKGLIANAYSFEIYARLVLPEATSFKAGEYEFLASHTFKELLSKILRGETKNYKLTIPEGYNWHDVCNQMANLLQINAKDCRNFAYDVSLLLHTHYLPTLEGFLFPDTYLYEKLDPPQALFSRMVHNFYGRIEREFNIKSTQDFLVPDIIVADKIVKLNLSEWVTLASIVEKETGLATERPMIARVFLNRLLLDMPLQTDPTVIYGIHEFNGNLTRRDLETDSPYNTYIRKGLPLGPICNPGIESLRAVLHPANTNDLYFVAKGDGSHEFSENYSQHLMAVQKFQLRN